MIDLRSSLIDFKLALIKIRIHHRLILTHSMHEESVVSTLTVSPRAQELIYPKNLHSPPGLFLTKAITHD